MFAHLLENLVDINRKIEQPKKPILNGAMLPPFAAIEKYLQPSGTNVRTMDNGWSLVPCCCQRPAASYHTATGR